jgi:ferritin
MPVPEWMVAMQYRQPVSKSCSSISLPTAARFAAESNSLSEKLERQIQWMQKRGIDIRLKQAERPPVDQKKSPLPGTVLYFASDN